MKTVLILSNHHLYTYNLRKELIQKLIDSNYKVVLALPYGEKVDLLKEMGCEFIHVPLDRRGTNPIAELKLIMAYLRTLKIVKPDIVLTYTLKPNLYGGVATRIMRINTIHTVTGLGSVFVRNVKFKNTVIKLNRFAFKGASVIVFMNDDNKQLYENERIISPKQKTITVAGSGVNLDVFRYAEPIRDSCLKFTFIGRILKDKGIEEFLTAAKEIKEKYDNVKFEVVGFVDEEKYKKMLKRYEEDNVIDYLGKKDDIPQVMKNADCIVLPSYGEGKGTVLQEAAAVGRPLITTNTYGCKDNVDEGYNGFLCEVSNAKSLINAIEKFINLSPFERELMGKRSREKAEKEFDRSIVVNSYIEEINRITGNFI